MKPGQIGVAATLVTFLSGCAPHPVPIVHPFDPSAPVTTAKTVLAGKSIRLVFNVSMNPDCSLRPSATIRIVTAPMHGTTSISDTEDFPNYPATNARSACNKTKTKGIQLQYTPEPGYLGTDYLTYEIIFDDGMDKTVNVPITVK